MSKGNHDAQFVAYIARTHKIAKILRPVKLRPRRFGELPFAFVAPLCIYTPAWVSEDPWQILSSDSSRKARSREVMQDATRTLQTRGLVTQADVPLFKAHHAQTWGIPGPSYHYISSSCIIHIISCISPDIIMNLSKRERTKSKTLLELLNIPFPSAPSWNPTLWINPL